MEDCMRNERFSKLWRLFPVLLGFLVVTPAFAGDVNLSGLSGLFVASSGKTLPAGQFVVAGGGFYGGDGDFDTYAIPVIVSYGIMENLETGISFPLVTGVDPDGLKSTSGIGDMNLSVKYGFMAETEGAPAAAAGFRLKLPFADDNERLGTGNVDAGFLFAASKTIGRADCMLNVEYVLVGGDDPITGRDLNNEVNYAVGVATDYSETLRLSIELVDHAFILNNFFRGDLLLAGLRYNVMPSLELGLSGGFGLTDPSTDLVFGGTVAYAF